MALGVFDGVHRGHRVILKSAAEKARRIKGTSVVMTFWPHPQKEESLYSLRHRLKLISEFGIDICIVVGFNKRFSRITAAEFVRDILAKRIGAKFIFIGENFTFGFQGKGNASVFKAFAKEFNFKLKIFPAVRINGSIISSTGIRRLIKAGKLAQAQKLLTRPVSILGTVIKGSSLARKLGIPTANINPHHEVLPPPGVYAVRFIYRQKQFFGVCSIGNKPTLGRNPIQYIEVHIFKFKKNIYGAYLIIEFMKFLRKQKKFASLQSLVKQIQKDIARAKALFSLP
jgi:riboflavin kinase/FMN adenylyltransferase